MKVGYVVIPFKNGNSATFPEVDKLKNSPDNES